MKLSPTWSNMCEKQPMSTINGYTTFTVCIAKLLTDARSLIAARSSSDFTLYFMESTLMSSLATSSPVMDFASICMHINRCSRFHSSLTKRTSMAIASPSREVPSKMTDRCLSVIYSWICSSSRFRMNGTKSHVAWSVKQYAFSSSRSLKLS